MGGKPLISYAISAAVDSRSLDRIVVATDDQEIAEVARSYGAETPYFLSKEITEDNVPMMPVLRDVMDWLEKNDNYTPDYVLLVQPTSPFVQVDQIRRAFELIKKRPEADSLTTIVELPSDHHPFNLRLINEEGYLHFAMPKERELHGVRQTKPKRYAFGNFWIFKPEVIKAKNIPIGDKCLPLFIDETYAFDINTANDLAMAEKLLPIIFSSEN